MAVWNRGYEDTIRDRQDRKISRVSFFSPVATSDREFVHGHVHLSACDLQFNATASSRNASALSDEEDTNPTAQKKRLSLPRYFLLLARLPPSPLDYSHSSTVLSINKILLFLVIFFFDKNLLLLIAICYI